jgi:hypothetical protein
VLNGVVTQVTDYVHDASDRQQVRFDGGTFDEAAGPDNEPLSGSISAEWAPQAYARKGATISFP